MISIIMHSLLHYRQLDHLDNTISKLVSMRQFGKNTAGWVWEDVLAEFSSDYLGIAAHKMFEDNNGNDKIDMIDEFNTEYSLKMSQTTKLDIYTDPGAHLRNACLSLFGTNTEVQFIDKELLHYAFDVLRKLHTIILHTIKDKYCILEPDFNLIFENIRCVLYNDCKSGGWHFYDHYDAKLKQNAAVLFVSKNHGANHNSFNKGVFTNYKALLPYSHTLGPRKFSKLNFKNQVVQAIISI